MTCQLCNDAGLGECFCDDVSYPGPLDPDNNWRALDRREPIGDYRDDQYNYSKEIGDE